MACACIAAELIKRFTEAVCQGSKKKTSLSGKESKRVHYLLIACQYAGYINYPPAWGKIESQRRFELASIEWRQYLGQTTRTDVNPGQIDI